jgi:hypothetical protein
MMILFLIGALFAFVGIAMSAVVQLHIANIHCLRELARTLAVLEDRLEAVERLAYGVRAMPRLTVRGEKRDG